MKNIEKDIRHIGIIEKRFTTILNEFEKLKDDLDPEKFHYVAMDREVCSLRNDLTDRVYQHAMEISYLSDLAKKMKEVLAKGVVDE